MMEARSSFSINPSKNGFQLHISLGVEPKITPLKSRA